MRRAARNRRKLLALAAALGVIVTLGVMALWLSIMQAEMNRHRYEASVFTAAMKILHAETILSGGLMRPASRASRVSFGYRGLLHSHGRLIAGVAVDELSEAIDLLDGRFEAYFLRARGLRLLDRDQEASYDLARALELRPGFAPVRYILSQIEGREFLSPATQLADADPWGDAWARAYRAMEERLWGEATRVYGKLIEMEEQQSELYLGSSVEFFLLRGVAFLEVEEFDAARLDFALARRLARRSWDVSPEPVLFPVPVLLLGRAYYLDSSLEGGQERAEALFLDAFEQADARDRDEIAVWIVAVYRSVGVPSAALEWAGRIEDPYLRARVEQDIFFMSGEYANAVSAGKEAVRLNPEDAGAHRRLALALIGELWTEGRFGMGLEPARREELIGIARRACELAPHDHRVLSLLGQAWKAVGELDTARELWARSAEMYHRRTRESVSGSVDRNLNSADIHQGQFRDIMPVEAVNTPISLEGAPVPSADRLELYFSSERAGGSGRIDIWVVSRTEPTAAWGSLRNVEELNSPDIEQPAWLSPDGLRLYFMTGDRGEIRCATRKNTDPRSRWEPGRPEDLERINTSHFEGFPTLTGDECEIYFGVRRPDGSGHQNADIWVARRPHRNLTWSHPVNLEEINTADIETCPCISPDGFRLFFTRFRGDIWYATRASREERFEPARRLGPPVRSESKQWEGHFRIDHDWPAPGSLAYFMRGSSRNTLDIYRATWQPGPPIPMPSSNGKDTPAGKVSTTE